MRYAIRFYRGCPILNDANEIIIKYDTRTSKLINFVKRHKRQRVIAKITELEDIESSIAIFTAAARVNKNFTILLSLSQKEIVPVLAEENLNFFFTEGVDTFDKLMAQVEMGVSDVYIINELGFSLDKVNKICHTQNITIRTFPNVAQSSSSTSGNLDTFKFFFIRPEDVPEYENYIDVLEFFGPIDKQESLYRIYRGGKWNDTLRYLIIGLHSDILSNMIAPGFAARRTHCGKKCYYDRCKTCQRILELADAMQENGYQFDADKLHNKNSSTEVNLQNAPSRIEGNFNELSSQEISESYIDE